MNGRVLALCATSVAVVAGAALAFKRRTLLQGALVTNDRDVAQAAVAELPDVVRRARKAGARGALEYQGAGMTAVVVCDARNRGYKIARRAESFLRSMFSDEAEWYTDARRAKGVRQHLPRFYRYHPGPVVIERECVRGRPGRWGDASTLFDLHKRIEAAMISVGWTSPEFKEDSYIFDERTGTPKLVDAGMAQKVGAKLVEYVEGVLDGRTKLRHGDRLSDLAFYVGRERDQTISPGVADRVLARLASRGVALT